MLVTFKVLPYPVDILPSDAYIALKYPKSGAYLDTSGAMVYLVDKLTNLVTMLSKSMLSVLNSVESSELIIGTAQQSFTANDFLKAIAISQKPELAKELLNV